MNIQDVKLDLINWLIHLKDEAVINNIQSIKNNSTDSIDTLFENNEKIKQLLDSRLKEKSTDFLDAKKSLNKLREQYGL